MLQLRVLAAVVVLSAGCDVAPVEPPQGAEFSFPVLDPADALRPPESVLDSFAGCYEFAVKLHPSMPGGDGTNIRAELRKIGLTYANEFELVLLPKPRWPPRWQVRKGEAVFAWSTGFVGVAFRLVRGGSEPEALAGDFADAGPKIHPTYSKVNVKAIPCPL